MQQWRGLRSLLTEIGFFLSLAGLIVITSTCGPAPTLSHKHGTEYSWWRQGLSPSVHDYYLCMDCARYWIHGQPSKAMQPVIGNFSDAGLRKNLLTTTYDPRQLLPQGSSGSWATTPKAAGNLMRHPWTSYGQWQSGVYRPRCRLHQRRL